MGHPNYRIRNLDHLGLVAGMCRELGLARMIDQVMPKQGEHHVSHGQALVAMIINGLGFTGRTLHMYPQFFSDKPLERLLGSDIQPEHLNDDTLGRTLDALFEGDVSALYQAISCLAVKKLGLGAKALHLDITSFHVDGDYSSEEGDIDSQCIQLVKGYSRDHRPDLNQVILELICENQAGIPVFMQALSGNTNDQKAFSRIARMHIKSLKEAHECRYLVGDAALYTAESILALHQQGQLFVSRVPMTIKEAKQQVLELNHDSMTPLGNGYHGYWISSCYAGVPQRWLMVRSEQAAHREHKTLAKNLKKESAKELKAFHKLCSKRFACQEDAELALCEFQGKLRLLHIENAGCISLPVFDGPGRPGKQQTPSKIDYFLTGQPATDLPKVDHVKAQAGVFIITTNDLDESLEMSELLTIYKSQQSVEKGFRFLKSPDFLTSSLFLKKPERIEALLMVMTCSLMIYAALEHRIRESLKQNDRHFNNMKNKPTQKPTARWVFQCFGGIHQLQDGDAPPIIVGLKLEHRVIIGVLGKLYESIYS